MKRKFPLLLAVLLLLPAVCAPPARAADMPSAERDGGISVGDDDVPLIELPTATVMAEVTVDENGAAAAVLRAEQLLDAVESVANGDAVRITVTAASGAENASTVSAVMPTAALQAVVEQTGVEMEVITDVGRMTLPNAAIASIVERAAGGDVTFRMRAAAPGEVPDGLGDIPQERIQQGSVTDIDILSGGRSITSWDGGAAILCLPAGSGPFEEGRGYRVIQLSADGSRTGHTGRCAADGAGLHVEISITHLSTFVVLAGAVEEDMGGGPAAMVASPLAARTGGGNSMACLWAAAAGLVLAASAAGGVLLRYWKKS